MIKLDPSAFHLSMTAAEFRDTVVTLYNEWLPQPPYHACGLEEFFIRARTHYLPFIEHVRADFDNPHIPDYIIGAALLQARKLKTARVRPFLRNHSQVRG